MHSVRPSRPASQSVNQSVNHTQRQHAHPRRQGPHFPCPSRHLRHQLRLVHDRVCVGGHPGFRRRRRRQGWRFSSTPLHWPSRRLPLTAFLSSPVFFLRIALLLEACPIASLLYRDQSLRELLPVFAPPACPAPGRNLSHHQAGRRTRLDPGAPASAPPPPPSWSPSSTMISAYAATVMTSST
jgi:hypothetical protein